MRDTFNKYLEDAGVDSLIPKLEEWGFYTAPASTNHHCNHDGGLLEHTLNVINYGLEIGDIMGYVDTPRLITACGTHDIGKSNNYYLPNYLSSGRQSNAKPYKINPDLNIKDHALRGVLMLQPYLNMDDDLMSAILYHMGFYERTSADYWRNPSILSMIVHYADMMATKKENGEL